MTTINLLPENFIKKKKEALAKSDSSLPMLLSFLMLAITVFTVAYLYVENGSLKSRIKVIDDESNKVDADLEASVKENDLLMLENKARDVGMMIPKQLYFSQALNYLQDRLIENVYANSIKIDPAVENLSVVLELATKDYLSISNQLYIFKSDKMVEKAEISDIKENDDNTLSFEISITAKYDLIKKITEDQKVE